MAQIHTVKGSCECNRNIYAVAIPESAVHEASVYFDTGATSRRLQAAPLTAFLRVPLAWYQSQTIPMFEDESHQSIRRHYSPANAVNSRRTQFCGYCGSQLSSWDETTRSDADFISLTIGSILDEDLALLEDLNLLPQDDEDDELDQTRAISGGDVAVLDRTNTQSVKRRGAPWFEEMIEHSRLGRVRRQKGGHTTADGSTNVSWEIIEIDGAASQEDGSANAGIKRKHTTEDNDIRAAPRDVNMHGAPRT